METKKHETEEFEKKRIESIWVVGKMGKLISHNTINTQYTQFTHITLISNYSNLENHIKILLILLNELTIKDISEITLLNINIISKIIHRPDRDTGLLDNGYVEEINTKPLKYKITPEGLKILQNKDKELLIQQQAKAEQEAHQRRLIQEIEDLRFLIKQYFEKEITARLTKKYVKIDFAKMVKINYELANRILEDPEEMVKRIEVSIKEAFDVNLEVRFSNLPKNQNLKVGEIRIQHINKLYSFDGIIKQTSQVRPLVKIIKYECPSCGNIIPVLQLDHKIKEPAGCGCGRKGYFTVLNKEMIDLQVLKLEELPEQLFGRTNCSQITVLIKGTLAKDKLQKYYNPGSRIRINGVIKDQYIIKNNAKDVKLDLVIEANYVEPQTKIINYVPTPEDKEKIIEISKMPDCVTILTSSLFPDLHDIHYQKLALILALVKGNKNHIVKRQEIHVLFAGEPGLAKSDLLTRLSTLMSDVRYANGASSSSVGLTASVIKDEFTGSWSLNAGTVVMANEGVCCVDEIDKMRDEDKNDLNECAEQGTVTINKAGISGSLQAKTTLIVACNPKNHQFEDCGSFIKQLDLPHALLTRFDLIFLLKNTDQKMLRLIDKIIDSKQTELKLINEELLVKYILTARQLNPELTPDSLKKIKDRMRGVVEYRKNIDNNMPFTIRQLHAITRLSTAFAKLRLSDRVEGIDVDKAWDIYVHSIKSTHLEDDLIESKNTEEKV